MTRALAQNARRRKRFPIERLALFAAGILLALGASWLGLETLRLRSRLSRVEAERAELERRFAGQPSPAQAPLSFVLTPGLTRAAAGPQKLVIPPGAPVRLQLDLKSPGRYPGYRVIIRTPEGEEIWGQDLPLAEPALAMELPPGLLVPRDYLVRLQGRTSRGTYEDLASFAFRVVRK